jgi:hypothetical protein
MDELDRRLPGFTPRHTMLNSLQASENWAGYHTLWNPPVHPRSVYGLLILLRRYSMTLGNEAYERSWHETQRTGY